MSRSNHRWNNGLLILGVLILAIAPLIVVREAEFSGSDGEAEAAIQSANPDYQPWSRPIFEPPSGEIESLLFALQAALGAGTIGYVVGLSRGRQMRQPETLPETTQDIPTEQPSSQDHSS